MGALSTVGRDTHERYDFVVVGAGTSGTILASSLAGAGFEVFWLETGDADAEWLSRWYPRLVPGGGEFPLYPPNAVWNELRDATGDVAWDAATVRRWYQQMERVENRPFAHWMDRWLYHNPARRGFAGWWPTQAAGSSIAWRTGGLADEYFSAGDPNDWDAAEQPRECAWLASTSEAGDPAAAVRAGFADERRERPSRLVRRRGVRATRVLFDRSDSPDRPPRATGVEYVELPSEFGRRAWTEVPRRWVEATRGVVLAAGSLETAKLLLLSGVGPAENLAAHRIETIADRPGVGATLAACHEIVVESDAPGRFASLGPDDGTDTLVVRLRALATDEEMPDALVLRTRILGGDDENDRWRWTVLHRPEIPTRGAVGLRSSNPLDPPWITYDGFETEGTTKGLMEGVGFVRRLLARGGVAGSAARLTGGAETLSLDSTPAAVEAFVRAHARARSLVGTCPIGGEFDRHAVLDSRFRVIGTRNLRVVDAAAFPHLPDFGLELSLAIAADRAAAEIARDEPREKAGIARSAPPNPLRDLAYRTLAIGAGCVALACGLTEGRRFVFANWAPLAFTLIVLAVIGVSSRPPRQNDYQRA